jgi:TorA maturation chaperone TorD
MSTVAIKTEARQRALAYAFLADCYDAPLDGERLASLAAAAGTGENADAGLAAPLCAALSGRSDWTSAATGLAVEHARLFLGLREGHSLAPPYASLWHEGQLIGRHTREVAGLYAAVGFSDPGRPGPCDRLPSLLRFMASLCDAEDLVSNDGTDTRADALRTSELRTIELRDLQADFLDAHLLSWLPDYCKTLIASTREPFYRALAEVTVQALSEDAAYLAAQPRHGRDPAETAPGRDAAPPTGHPTGSGPHDSLATEMVR